MTHSLSSPAGLAVKEAGHVWTGGSQDWYPDPWQRRAGCGPTTASTLVWYLSQVRPDGRALRDTTRDDRDSYLALQLEMFDHVTPGKGGVNTSALFVDGLVRFAAAHGVTLTPQVLEVPKRKRPSRATLSAFVQAGLEADCPVAFLNLSNGNQRRLDSWHWVTITGFEPDIIQFADQGRTLTIDIAQWLSTSLLGGALVYFT